MKPATKVQRNHRCLSAVVFTVIAAMPATIPFAQQQRVVLPVPPTILQSTLIVPGSHPFHLRATVTNKDDPGSPAEIEMYWVSPAKWRRTIRSEEFSQTLIVNGELRMEQNTDDYFPLALETLITAMVDPRPILDARRPDDVLLTKANGAAKEPGTICYPPDFKICVSGPHHLRETVHAPGRPVTFTDYQDFHGKKVARRILTQAGPAQITELSDLKNVNEELFSISQPTPPGEQLRILQVAQSDLAKLALGNQDIIWPQPLDGATKGTSIFYVSIDRKGRVREAVPVQTDNERTNETAQRQILKWKFKPVVSDGAPVQAESLFSFSLNTRAWGPAAPLTDAEVRKLASNIVEPVIQPGAFAPGTTYTLRLAVDDGGNLIEVIAGNGPPKLFAPCYAAIRKWHFSPVLENGEPRPYRAEVAFHIP